MKTLVDVLSQVKELDAQFVTQRNNVYARMAVVIERHLEELRRLDATLTVPAAEYVPAIQDAFDIIDDMLGKRNATK